VNIVSGRVFRNRRAEDHRPHRFDFRRLYGIRLLRLGALVLSGLLLVPSARRMHAQSTTKVSTPKANGPASVENGKKLYVKDGCYECHGLAGQGSVTSGPRLASRTIPHSVFLGYVRQPTGQMPPYTAKVITDGDLADIHSYLESLPPPPPLTSVPLLNQ
jgi:mono/diheme cytochrome c family protein